MVFTFTDDANRIRESFKLKGARFDTSSNAFKQGRFADAIAVTPTLIINNRGQLVGVKQEAKEAFKFEEKRLQKKLKTDKKIRNKLKFGLTNAGVAPNPLPSTKPKRPQVKKLVLPKKLTVRPRIKNVRQAIAQRKATLAKGRKNIPKLKKRADAKARGFSTSKGSTRAQDEAIRLRRRARNQGELNVNTQKKINKSIEQDIKQLKQSEKQLVRDFLDSRATSPVSVGGPKAPRSSTPVPRLPRDNRGLLSLKGISKQPLSSKNFFTSKRFERMFG